MRETQSTNTHAADPATFNIALAKATPPKLHRTQADKRIDFLLKKYYDDNPDFRPQLLHLAHYDPTPKKTYLAWLVKHWHADWKPDDAELKRIAGHLETHHKGAKYFSPLSWTGLRLEDAGYHTDIFQYSPATLGTLAGAIAKIIRIDEEDKQIRKGNLVATGGAEVAYKDERWTLVRVRTKAALKRLGQDCGWCVCGDGMHGYSFPFDILIDGEGERFLAHPREVRGRWNIRPSQSTLAEIKRIQALAADGYDHAKALVEEAIQAKRRHDAEVEQRLMRHPDLAIRYAEQVIGAKWTEFERHVRVATLSAQHAAEYAIKCRRERWPRFENKIKRAGGPLAQYREAFPGSIPKTREELFQDKLNRWRERSARAYPSTRKWSVLGQAESRERNVDFEDCLLKKYSEDSIKRFARLVASLATSEMQPEYRTKTLSYFEETKHERTQTINTALGPLICENLHRRLPEVEMLIADHPGNSFAYATGIAQRFIAGESAIRREPDLWWQYDQRFLRSYSQPLAPRPSRIAWS